MLALVGVVLVLVPEMFRSVQYVKVTACWKGRTFFFQMYIERYFFLKHVDKHTTIRLHT